MNTATKIVTGFLAVVVVILLAAPSQSGSSKMADEMQRMRVSIANLELRVDNLEGRAALESRFYTEGETPRDAPPDAAEPARASNRKVRVMMLDGVQTVDRDPDEYEELERLRNEVKALERSVESAKQRTTSMAGSGGGGYRGGYSGGYVKNTGASRRRQAQGSLMADYQKKLRDKTGEMKKLERELQEPKQIILGNWDGHIITLKSSRDLSRKLDRIDPGEYLEFEGRRVSHAAGTQEWVVHNINKVDESELPE